MFRAGTVLALSLTIGVLAQSCDLGGFTIDDVRDRVVVTNASPATAPKASVIVAFDYGDVGFYLKPGGHATALGLASTTYEVIVGSADDSAQQAERDRLLELRDQLVELSTTPEAMGANLASAVSDLYLVETALRQMENGLQTCHGKLTAGVDGQATVNWTDTAGGGGVWVLSCG